MLSRKYCTKRKPVSAAVHKQFPGQIEANLGHVNLLGRSLSTSQCGYLLSQQNQLAIYTSLFLPVLVIVSNYLCKVWGPLVTVV